MLYACSAYKCLFINALLKKAVSAASLAQLAQAYRTGHSATNLLVQRVVGLLMKMIFLKFLYRLGMHQMPLLFDQLQPS